MARIRKLIGKRKHKKSHHKKHKYHKKSKSRLNKTVKGILHSY
jgi:hypothetical protein